jgi:Hemerythrin HHE cation binding domain
MTSQAYATTLDPEPVREARALRPVDVDAAADAARMLVALHERVERQFEAYEAAEGSAAGRYQAVAAVAKALATHVAVEDELLYPTLKAHTGRHDAEIERQLQPDQDRLEAAPVGARRPPVAAGRGGYVRCCRARSDVS